MKLRDIIDSPCEIRYMIDTLPLSSGFALSRMMDFRMLDTRDEISFAYSEIRRYMPVHEQGNENILFMLRTKLCCLKDISRTIARIEAGSPVDDIELFEIKHLVLLALDIKDLLEKCRVDEKGLSKEILEKILSILDPDGMKIDSFYIFDSYSPEIAELRRTISSESNPERRERLLEEERLLERKIRERLCAEIAPFSSFLNIVLNALVNCDILIAKGEQMKKEGLCYPELTENRFNYVGMFHPYIRFVLAEENKEFTGIDISFGNEPVLVIGANMGGKTVILKMLAQCQYLMRLGMGIPAEKAEIALKKDIFFISGDAQNLAAGLSSFAAEMKSIDEVVKKSQKEDPSILALIDEPAKSTNPIEGTALVEALINILRQKNGIALVLTTHYNIGSYNCLRYKISGFYNGKMNYKLCVAPDGEIPKEALTVAEALDISPIWIEEAKKLLKNE